MLRSPKFLLAYFAWVLAAMAAPTARYDYVWPSHAIITFDVPFTWSLTGAQAGEVGFNFRAVPKNGAAALLQISLFNPPPEKPLLAGKLDALLAEMVQPYVTGSVEKKYASKPIRMQQGTGIYAQFTDASLVGKPPVPGDFKMMRNALLALDEHALVVVTMQYDDPRKPEADEMLALVASMRLNRHIPAAPPVLSELSLRREGESYLITVPQSKFVLKMPESGLVLVPVRLGGATNNPRYFYMVGDSTGLAVSGWFESGHRYKGLKDFWASEVKGLTKGGFSAPTNVEFLRSDNWEIVSYEMPLSQGTHTTANLRAEFVTGDTWIDLHFSLTGVSPAAARDQLLAIIKASQVLPK